MENIYTKFNLIDIDQIAPLYLNYFNEVENASWTLETVKRKFKQLLHREDVLAFKLENKCNIIGFFIGQLVQFDDGLVFELLELLVFKEHQNQGYGSMLLLKAIEDAKKEGAFMIQLTSAVDEEHYHFYNTKHGFSDATNNIWKTKIF
ncbi:MAG: GNAT family N-acetyltransferase [Acholeplasmataceae bacterium]